MSRRKNKKKDEGMDESWLLPYADILTLLLALFIVLYAMSSVDAQKFEEISQAFNSVFVGDQGILNESEIISPEMPNSEIPLHPKDQDDPAKDDGGKDSGEDDDGYKGDAGLIKHETEELEKVQKRVESYIAKNALSERFETSLTRQGLLITIRDNVLFDSGSAEVSNVDKKTAEALSELLFMDPQREVVISGHTDNIPIQTVNYESNWELSVSRAVNFMKTILEREELDPRFFSAKGSGEHQPVATNDTNEGRAKNRRVEILILPLINIELDVD